MLLQAFCIISYPLVNSNLSYSPETPNLGQIPSRATLKFDGWPCKTIGHLFYATSKLSASFCSHWWIQTSITVQKRPIWVKLDDFQSRATLKFDGWPCKTIGHLFYATSSFMHHFVPIGEFKLELQSGNAQSGSNSEPCDLEIWRMTLQNNRAPLLCYFKLSASFRTHWWIQTWVTVRKRPIWVKFDDF